MSPIDLTCSERACPEIDLRVEGVPIEDILIHVAHPGRVGTAGAVKGAIRIDDHGLDGGIRDALVDANGPVSDATRFGCSAQVLLVPTVDLQGPGLATADDPCDQRLQRLG